jgi:hypothetical protein
MRLLDAALPTAATRGPVLKDRDVFLR